MTSEASQNSDTQLPAESDQPEAISLAEFLEDIPPNVVRVVHDLGHTYRSTVSTVRWRLSTPDLQLYCSECSGVRTFAPTGNGADIWDDRSSELFSRYVCRNCRKHTKTYSLTVRLSEDGEGAGVAVKVGEHPRFGPPVPSRAISLVGSDRDLFLKGRSAESMGLGVGAYAYYRRVVDNQWGRFLSEIIRVAERTGAKSEAIKQLKAAAAEQQFSKAVGMVKDAVPDSLKIDGHNPLTLLYSSLSEGVHDMSDEDCLELAAAIRAVLYELADRISMLLKDQAELQTALSRLLNRGRSTS